MSQVRFPLIKDHYYHIFNRGVARQPTFKSKYDYDNMVTALSYYRFVDIPMRLSYFKTLSQDRKQELSEQLSGKSTYVDILAFALMPNHFHLLLRQNMDNGISKYISQVCNSYSRYFNTKYGRGGPVFQGRFKSVLVESDEQLIHLSRYIHLNPVVSAVIKDTELLDYKYSSFKNYVTENRGFVKSEQVLAHFKTNDKYKEFVLDHAGYAAELEKLKHLTLESNE